MRHHHMALRRGGQPVIVYIRAQRCRHILEQRHTGGVVQRGDRTGDRRHREIPQHVGFRGGIPNQIGGDPEMDLTKPRPLPRGHAALPPPPT